MALADLTPYEKDCAKLAKSGSDSARFAQLLKRHWQYVMEESPEFATSVGYPGQDARWTDRSFAAYARRRKELDAPYKALKTIARAKLSEADQLSFDLFKRSIEEARENRKFPEELLPLSQMWGVQREVSDTLSLMPQNSATDFETILKRMEAIPTLLEQVILLLKEGARTGVTYPRIAMEKVAEQLKGLLEPSPEKNVLFTTFKELPETVTPSDRIKLLGRAKRVFSESVLPAFTKLTDYFVKEYLPQCRTETGWNAMPNGADWYAFRVQQSTTTTLTPKEIHAIGLKEVARILKEMEKVKASAGFKGDLTAFNDFLRADPQFYYTREEDLLRGYRDLAKRIDPELPKLVGKLPRLPYGVSPIPAYAADASPTAYYQPGSPTAGRAGTFFANTSNLKARPKWEMEALTLHEAVPGHHLQIALAQEMEDVPEFRKHEGYNAYVEGWALYCEGLGSSLGLYKDPYSQFGALTYEMWRSIRLVVDTGLHSMNWTREKAIGYFRDNAGKADHDIVQEVDRYLVMPGQALGYKIGHLKIQALRSQAEKKLGAKFEQRKFHDALLGDGALPLDILEKRITRWLKHP